MPERFSPQRDARPQPGKVADDSSEQRIAVEAARLGCREAFDWLYQQHYSQIYNFLYRLMGDSDDAEDLTQDTFVKAWKYISKTAPGTRFGAWIYRVATNTALDELRHRKLVNWQSWDAYISVFHPSQVAPDSPEREALNAERTAQVQQILSTLNAPYREALLLREYGQLSYDEIAACKHTTRAAVKSTLFRGREQFREAWMHRGHATVEGEIG